MIAAVVFVFIASGIAVGLRGYDFGLQTAITGIISVALLCVYVVYVARVMADAKSAADGASEDVAVSVAHRIQIASLIRLFVVAVVCVLLIIVLKFDVWAVIAGVSAIYAPMLIVPNFVKPTANGESGNKECK